VRAASTPEFLQGLRRWCDEQNLVLICDEVQAGMGRTGTFFSWEQYGIAPDITTLAKGLAGGVPIGAMLAAPRVDIFEPGDHGTTFGGNPIACAAGVATVRTIVEHGLLENARQIGDYLGARLQALEGKYPFITQVRGIGLMRAFDLAEPNAQQIMDRAMAHGLLITNAGPSIIRIIPPLIITQADVDEAMALLDLALSEL
jgi:acetylornithine/N-succinyldiaminopimelate aminotransferase